MSSRMTLHVDHSQGQLLRSRIFGHDGVIIPFREGFIAKKCRLSRELKFYKTYAGSLHNILEPELIPSVEGIVDDNNVHLSSSDDEVDLEVKKEIDISHHKSEPYLMMHDIADGYSRPAVLDVKLGTRTWALGAPKTKRERMKMKCSCPTSQELCVRVRAAMWYSRNPDQWPVEENINCVKREWGNKCSKLEFMAFLEDFFHYPNQIPVFVEKLKKLKVSMQKMREQFGARMYSSSIVFAYDEDDPSKFDCRLLDFAKTYLDIENAAQESNENVEECEDAVIPALESIISMIESLV